VKVPVVKGSAAFWFDLLPSGEIGEINVEQRPVSKHKFDVTDKRVRHSGCPILVGTKWIANKWISMKSQVRECTLKHEIIDESVWIRKFTPFFKQGKFNVTACHKHFH
jgi:hypothetical protein